MNLNTIMEIKQPASIGEVPEWRPEYAWLAGGTWLFSTPQIGTNTLIDLESPLWQSAPFTAFLLSRSDIDDVALTDPLPPITVLSATPITATEAAWVRLKGADAMREAWQQDNVDVLDPTRRAAQPS